MLRTRKVLAVVCIAAIVFGTVLPAAATFVYATLVPLWLVVPAVAVTIIRRAASRCDDQPVSLVSLVAFRAPPADAVLA